MSQEDQPTLNAKRQTAAVAGEVISITGLKRHWEPRGVINIEGQPGETGVVVSAAKDNNPLAAYRHPSWVLVPDTHHSGGTPTLEQHDPWKWETATPDESQQNANAALTCLSEGALPKNFQLAIEIEGTAHKADGQIAQAIHPQHPELNTCTYEDATKPHPEVISLAQAIAGLATAFARSHPGLYLELSSAPQVGDLNDIHLNPHPYLQMAAPKVAALVGKIHPRAATVLATLTDYNHPTPESLFEEYQLRLWPVSAIHTHVGIPTSATWQKGHQGVDGILGINMLNALYTIGLHVSSLIDSSSTHFLGRKTRLADVRHSLRRLLPTANGSRPYRAYGEELPPWKQQLIDGKIHSASRYPYDDQHGIGRPRTDLETIEATNSGSHPHLGVQVALAASVRLHTVVGIESTTKNPTGSTSDHGQSEYGLCMAPITPQLMVDIEAAFDQNGWDGQVEVNGSKVSLRSIAHQTSRMFHEIGKRYPPLAPDAQIAAGYLIASTQKAKGAHIARYFDPSSSDYARGVLTDLKTDTPQHDIPNMVREEAGLASSLLGLAKTNPLSTLLPPSIRKLLKSRSLAG